MRLSSRLSYQNAFMPLCIARETGHRLMYARGRNMPPTRHLRLLVISVAPVGRQRNARIDFQFAAQTRTIMTMRKFKRFVRIVVALSATLLWPTALVAQRATATT